MRHVVTTFIVFGVLNLAVSVSFAQHSIGVEPASKVEVGHSDLHFGIRVGSGASGESWDPSPPAREALQSTNAWSAGIQIDYWITSHYAVGLQVLYDERGFGDNGTEIDLGGVKAYYLEIPLTFKMRFGGPVVLPYVYAGPSLGILQSSTIEGHLGNDTLHVVDAKNAFAATALSVLGGGGIEVKMKHDWSLFVDAAYAIGLDNVDSWNSTIFGDHPNDPQNITHRVVKSWEFRLSTGIMVPL